MKTKRYCSPSNCGLSSEPQAVARQLAKLINSLDVVNRWNVDGAIIDDIEHFRRQLKERLEADGWTVSAMNGRLEGSDRLHVYTPDSKTGKRIRKHREQGIG